MPHYFNGHFAKLLFYDKNPIVKKVDLLKHQFTYLTSSLDLSLSLFPVPIQQGCQIVKINARTVESIIV
jgi:hypothetical protein